MGTGGNTAMYAIEPDDGARMERVLESTDNILIIATGNLSSGPSRPVVGEVTCSCGVMLKFRKGDTCYICGTPLEKLVS